MAKLSDKFEVYTRQSYQEYLNTLNDITEAHFNHIKMMKNLFIYNAVLIIKGDYVVARVNKNSHYWISPTLTDPEKLEILEYVNSIELTFEFLN